MSANGEITLPTFLAYPYLWNPEKFIRFVIATWAIIDDVNDVNKTLKIHLDNAFKKLRFVKPNWKVVLGVYHWEILRQTQDPNLPANLNGTWITDLLRLIRNKLSHKRNILKLITDNYENRNTFRVANDDIKSWFDTEAELVSGKFVAFWINKFPLLFPFLYTNFYQYRNNDSLIEYYKIRTDPLNHNFIWGMTEYITKLKNSLAKHLEEGSLLERYKYEHGSEKGVLEIRGCREIDNILKESDIIFIKANTRKNGALSVKHFSADGTSKRLQLHGVDKSTEPFCMVFTREIVDPEVWKFCSEVSNRIIIFGKEDMDNVDEEFITKTLAQWNRNIEIREFPLTWDVACLISPAKQKQIFEQGKVVIQGREVSIKDILSTCEGLSGEVLYQLLQNEKPQLFSKYELPQRGNVYLERQLGIGGCIQLEMLLKCCPNDIYIVSNITSGILTWLKGNESPKILNGTQNLKLVEVESLASVDVECGGIFYLLKDYEENFDILLEKCEWSDYPGNIHYIHFDQEGISHLVKTVCIPSCKMETEKNQALSEDQFIAKTFRSNIEPIMFVSPPGSGKSQLFASLAQKLTSKSFVINISMRNFYLKLRSWGKTRQVVKTHDIRAILKELTCNDDSERVILGGWLDQQNRHSERIELMLDGFDELPNIGKEYTLRALQVIQTEIPRIRLWLTSRELMQYGADKVSFFPCIIHPFSESDQVQLIQEHWCNLRETEMTEEEKTMGSKFVESLLQEFKAKLGTEISTPLNCSVLAEYCEDAIVSNSADKPLSIGYIYEKFMSKKFQVYLDKDLKFSTDLNRTFFIENFFLIHTYLSTKLLSLDEEDKEFKIPMIKKHLMDEAYLKMGIVTCNNPLTFNHFTFAEFLIARFICQVLENTFDLSLLCSVETFQELLVDILTISDHQGRPVVSNFLNDLLEMKDVTKLAMSNAYQPIFKNEHTILSCLKMTFKNKLEKVSCLILNIWKFEKTDEFRKEILDVARSHNVRREFLDELCELFRINQNGIHINNGLV